MNKYYSGGSSSIVSFLRHCISNDAIASKDLTICTSRSTVEDRQKSARYPLQRAALSKRRRTPCYTPQQKPNLLYPLPFDKSKQSNKQKVPFTSRVPRESCSMLVKRSRPVFPSVLPLLLGKERRKKEWKEGRRGEVAGRNR